MKVLTLMDHTNGGNFEDIISFKTQLTELFKNVINLWRILILFRFFYQELFVSKIFSIFSYETGDGISAQAQGVLKNAGTQEGETQEVSGSYAYTADDGSKIQISYIANENGYQPTGEGVPVIPPAIQRALDWIAAHPKSEEEQKK